MVQKRTGFLLSLAVLLLLVNSTLVQEKCSIANCLSCNQIEECSKCEDGMELVQMGENQIGCALLEKRSLQSISCDITNCLSCSATDYCQTCSQSFRTQSGKCLSCLDKCKSCDENNCFECYEGYYVNYGECWADTTDGFWTECADPHCDYCLNLQRCLYCFDGYYQDEYCKPCNIDGCASCDGPTNCQYCIDNLYFNTTTTTCSSCMVSNCYQCLNSTNCQQCDYGFYPPNCDPCNIANCYDCTDQDTCIQCDDTYLPFNGICYQCDIDECSYCNSSGICAQCQGNYILVNNKCSCGESCSDCLFGECYLCLEYYTMYDSKCVLCNISYCQICHQSNKCSDCSEFYSLINGTCSILCVVEYCQSCSANNICTSCKSNFTLSAGKCTYSLSKVKYCTAINNLSGICTACLEGYNLVNYQDPNNLLIYSQCIPHPDNCLVSYDGWSCYQCKNTFILKKTLKAVGTYYVGIMSCVCYSNQSMITNSSGSFCMCPNGTTLFQGACVSNCQIDNCISCKDSTCDQCAPGFLLSNGACSFKYNCNIDKCLTCLGDFYCTSCIKGYSVSSLADSCIESIKIDNCLSYQQGSCLFCALGYQFNGYYNYCFPCQVQNCVRCSKSNFCNTCAHNFSPDQKSGQCVVCPPPCLLCKDGLCTKCQQGFSQLPNSAGQCFVCSDVHCIACNSSKNNICLTCVEGYVLNSASQCEQDCLNYECDPSCQNNYPAMYYNSAISECSLCPDRNCLNCLEANPNVCLWCNQLTTYLNMSTSQCLPCPATSFAALQLGCEEMYNQYLTILATLVNSKVLYVACDPYCFSCNPSNPSQCFQCYAGSYQVKIDNNTNNTNACLPCMDGCSVCSNSSSCIVCFSYAFLQNGICKICTPPCVKCNLENCISCGSGYLLSGGKCIEFSSLVPSVSNCDNGYYKDSTFICTLCTMGSTPFNGDCVPCKQGCNTCTVQDPTLCISCKLGYGFASQLSYQCISCPDECIQCQQGICFQCSVNYYLTASLICAPYCQYPCLVCSFTNPKQCLSCLAGYIYDPNLKNCIVDISCNNEANCFTCPSGYSIAVNGVMNQTCIKCQNTNCFRCNPSNTSQCLYCPLGQYLDSVNYNCISCPSNCQVCNGPKTCIVCASGFIGLQISMLIDDFILLQNNPQPHLIEAVNCIACNSPCLSCVFTPSTCLSCVSGYQFSLGHCVSSVNFNISVVLDSTLKAFQQSTNQIISIFAQAIDQSVSTVKITNISSGSVKVNLNINSDYAPNDPQTSTQQSNLRNLLRTGSLANIKVKQSNLVMNVQGQSQDVVQSGSSLSLGVIIAIAVVVPLVITIIIVFLVVRYRRSSETDDISNTKTENRSDKSKTESIDKIESKMTPTSQNDKTDKQFNIERQEKIDKCSESL